MHNINIMFVPAGSDSIKKKKVLDINKSFNALASKRFFEVDYVFEDPVQQNHRKIQRQHSFQTAFDKEKTIEAYQKDLQKSELIYKSMLMNMHRSYLQNKEIPKRQPTFASQKDRTQIIHSRKSPRCHFWKRNSPISNSPARSQRNQGSSGNFIKLIDPEAREAMITPQGKRMSLSMKNERSFRHDLKQELHILTRKPVNVKRQSTPESPKRRFWNKNYRPWSPQRRNLIGVDEFCATIDQFTNINS